MTIKAKEARDGPVKKPLRGWDKGLNEEEKRWVEEWNRLDNKSAAARIVWPGKNAGHRGWSVSQRSVVQRAMSMIRGKAWEGPDTKPPEHRKNLTKEKRDRKWRTRTARLHHRNLDEMKPLDCLIATMQINWVEAERRVDRSGPEPAETADSLTFRKEACLYAREAAPYMHARLQSVEVREVDQYETMTDEELTKTIVGLLKEVGGSADVMLEAAEKEGKGGNGSKKPGMPPMRH